MDGGACGSVALVGCGGGGCVGGVPAVAALAGGEVAEFDDEDKMEFIVVQIDGNPTN